MQSGLEARSIALACGVAQLAMALTISYVLARQRTHPGFGAWTLSAWSAFTGISLVALRGVLPQPLTVVAADVCLIGSLSLIQIGMVTFCGRRPNLLGHALFLGLLAAAFQLFTRYRPGLEVRIVVASLAVPVLTLDTLLTARRHLRNVLERPNPLMATMLVSLGVVYFLRVPVTLLRPPPDAALTTFPVEGLFLLFNALAFTIIYGGLLVLNSQRVEQELQAALADAKLLRGIIPICAYCKQIRDDQGAWNQMEAYIREHSQAVFSHGICPECARREFGHSADINRGA